MFLITNISVSGFESGFRFNSNWLPRIGMNRLENSLLSYSKLSQVLIEFNTGLALLFKSINFRVTFYCTWYPDCQELKTTSNLLSRLPVKTLARFLPLALSKSKVQLWLSSLFKLLTFRRALFRKDISTSRFTFPCCLRTRLVVGRNELYSRLNLFSVSACSDDCSRCECCCCWSCFSCGWSLWLLWPVGISKQWQLRWLRIGWLSRLGLFKGRMFNIV